MTVSKDDLPYKEILADKQAKEDLLFKLKQLDAVLSVSSEYLEIYLIGGTACILGNYICRTTMDVDLIDIDYPAKAGKYLNILEPMDLLEFAHTSIPASFRVRARLIGGFGFLKCYILSPEDLIVSKLCRYADKDIEDIDKLLKFSDENIIKVLITEVTSDLNTRVPRIRESFKNNVAIFYRRHNIYV